MTEGAMQCSDIKGMERLTKYQALTMEELEMCTDMDFDPGALNKKRMERIDKVLQDRVLKENDITPQTGRDNINLLLLGKTGSGKSATANLLFGKCGVFKESSSSVSATKCIKKAVCEIKLGTLAVTVNLIDTPGFQDTSRTKEDVMTEFAKVVEEFSDGIDGFLFIYSMGNTRYTDDEQNAFEMIEKEEFGKGAIENCFVILTNIDTKKDIKSLSSYIKQEGSSPFGQLLDKKVARRVMAVNNADTTVYGREMQRQNIVRLILAKAGARFSSEGFKKYKRDQEELKNKLSEGMKQYAEDLQKEVAAELRGMDSKMIKGLRGETSKDREKLIREVGNKMRVNHEVKCSENEIREAVNTTLKDVSYRLVGQEFLKELSFGAVLWAAALGTIFLSSMVALPATLVVGGTVAGVVAVVKAFVGLAREASTT